jgi:heptosyltransferase-2
MSPLVHTIVLTEKFKSGSLEVAPGTYLVEDIAGAQLMVACDGGEMTKLHPEQVAVRHKFEHTGDWNECSVLILRAGGFGDLTLMTPVLRELRRRWPRIKIGFACFPHYRPVLEHTGLVDEFVEYPIPVKVADQYAAWVFMENIIEKNEDAKKWHMTDLFGTKFGFGVKEEYDRHPVYVVTDTEKVWVSEAYPRKKGVQRLAVQFKAQAMNRTYPIQRTKQVIEHFYDKGWEIMLLGDPGSLDLQSMDRLHNCAANRHTFRQSAAIISTADCVLAPDSALLHVAGALDIPAVGLFGPFPPELRVAYSPSVQAIDGKGHCAPCFHHVRRNMQFPAHGPCAGKGYCTVLDAIPVKKVIDRIALTAKKLFD